MAEYSNYNVIFGPVVSGSTVPTYSGSFYGDGSNITNINESISSSYAVTASYATGGGGSSLETGSTYPITSSWANSASFINASNITAGTLNNSRLPSSISVTDVTARLIGNGAVNQSTTTAGVSIGIESSTPRVVFSDGNSGRNWLIDNSSNQLRFFKPGLVYASLDTASFSVLSPNIIASQKIGIGVNNPVNALDVAGNVSASVITASLEGTASYSNNALTASVANSDINNNTLTHIVTHMTLTGSGDLYLPQGTLIDGMLCKWWIEQGGDGGYTLTPSADFVFPTGTTVLTLSTTVGSRDLLIGEYHAASGKVYLTGLLLFPPVVE